MCRLLAVVSSEATDFRFSLRDAPRNLAHLSHEHPDGWGLAVHDAGHGWTVAKHPEKAHADPRFEHAVGRARGTVLVAHIRKATVGVTSAANTHPFRRDRWVFAHNGTVRDTAWLAERTSHTRRAEIEGDTDSERFFAFLLSRLDEADDADAAPALWSAMEEAMARADLGSANFVLSDGAVLFAFRRGRDLHVLERGVGDRVRPSRRSAETGAVVDTPWSARRHAVLIASERMTDEPWREIAEGTLVTVGAGPYPTVRVVGALRDPAIGPTEP